MISLENTRPVWAEINLDNLNHNIKEVRKNVQKGSLIMAVVKANGYGHGSVEIAKTFLENGADRLAVAILTEAIELRNSGIEAPILVLGYTPNNQFDKVLKYDLIQTIYNYKDAKILSKAAIDMEREALIHIKIDTGMNRIGFPPNKEAIDKIVEINKLANINIEGIYTHFARADERDKEYTKDQFKKYIDVSNLLKEKGVDIKIKHVSNSAAIIDLEDYNLDMVRAGIMIYGYYPSNEVDRENIKLKPAMNLKARVSHIKIVPKETGISYGQIFKTKRKSKIATLPLGYADGFTRLLTGKAEVYVKGKRVKVVGKICMDQCMIDVTEVDDIQVGDEVLIFGYGDEDYPNLNELAEKIETINYEILCMISRRIPRVYISEGKIVKIRDYLLDKTI